MNTAIKPRQIGKPLSQERQLAVIRFSPDGGTLYGGDYQGGVQRWSLKGDTLTPLSPLAGHSGWVTALAMHADGKRLFTADSWGRLIGWADGKVAWTVAEAHDGWLRKLALSPDGKRLASCGRDGRVRVWDVEKGTKQAEVAHGADVLSLTFAPDGRSVVCGDLMADVVCYDLGTLKETQRWKAAGMYKLDRIQEVGGVRCLAFDPTGKVLAAGGCQVSSGGFVQGKVQLTYLDAASAKVNQTVTVGNDNEGYVHDLCWHADGFVMAATSGQPGVGKLLLHCPGEATPFFAGAMPNCHSLAAHPDGKRVVVAATNANSSGNGRNLTKEKAYPGNTSPLHVWQLAGG